MKDAFSATEKHGLHGTVCLERGYEISDEVARRNNDFTFQLWFEKLKIWKVPKVGVEFGTISTRIKLCAFYKFLGNMNEYR